MHHLHSVPPAATLEDAGAPRRRIGSLDSLRGLAALTVVLQHVLATPVFAAVHGGAGWAWVLAYTPLHVFFAGPEAVILFFVLSGFVLGVPYFSATPPRAGAFLIRRVCRIYLPYIAALAVALAAMSLVPARSIPPWTSADWDRPLTLADLVNYALMSGFERHDFFNPPVWSLVYEMRISLIFPLLIFIANRLMLPLRLILSLALFSVAAVVLIFATEDDAAVVFTVARTAYFLWLFVLGIELARYRERLIACVAQMGRPMKTGIAIAALLFYTIHWTVAPLRYHYALGDLFVGLGSALFILMAIAFPSVEALLSRSLMLGVGRISYSLYLSHIIILQVVLSALHGRLPIAVVLMGGIALAIAFAAVMYRAVELPAIQLGRMLARRWAYGDAGGGPAADIARLG